MNSCNINEGEKNIGTRPNITTRFEGIREGGCS